MSCVFVYVWVDVMPDFNIKVNIITIKFLLYINTVYFLLKYLLSIKNKDNLFCRRQVSEYLQY